jgi:hypothetical protein
MSYRQNVEKKFTPKTILGFIFFPNGYNLKFGKNQIFRNKQLQKYGTTFPSVVNAIIGI